MLKDTAVPTISNRRPMEDAGQPLTRPQETTPGTVNFYPLVRSTSQTSSSARAKDEESVRHSTALEISPSRASKFFTKKGDIAPPFSAVLSSSEREEPRPKKLGGIKLDLSLKPSDANGGLVTWAQLDATLLAIGRARYKEMKARVKEGASR
jgi:hypothetical protein